MNRNLRLGKIATLLLYFLSFSVVSQTLPAPIWRCIQTVGNDIQLNWEPVSDPGNQFVRYEISSVEDGLIASINTISTDTYLHTNVSNIRNYFIKIVDATGSSTGVIYQNIRLNINNPSDGTALLNWNTPTNNISNPFSNLVYIEREFPTGNWTRIDSLNNSVSFYKDTIDICTAFLNYRIVYPGYGCNSLSNVVGDFFEDKITPNIPKIQSVSVDTLTGEVQIDWNTNEQKDTYGYVIYKKDVAGFLVEIDTVWGVNNSFYSYVENTSMGSLTYSVAAFDSCFTQTLPPTYQTSAKANVHTSIFLQGQFNACAGSVSLTWSTYDGVSGPMQYEVFATDDQNNWVSRGIASSPSFAVQFQSSGIYDFVIRAFKGVNFSVFSNKISVQVNTSGPPQINYIQSASVESNGVLLKHLT
ncbi:MAG: hypothetical protein KJ941_11485, partial [Bacteroidetes bacterium]|nr:hypothetical protein [Bacteroidota bacterium]